MSATTEWDIPFTLSTPAGNLLFNAQDSVSQGYFMLDPTRCSSGRDMRVTRADKPQESGEILSPHYTGGYTASLMVELWEKIGEEGAPACGSLRVQMWDRLMLMLNSLLGDDPLLDANGRLYFTPSGHAERMLNNVRMLALPKPVQGADGFVEAAFDLVSEFPYVWDAAEVVTDIAGGATLTNPGSADFFPVMKVHGATNGFTITNESVVDQNGDPLSLVYDSALPGASAIASGHYVELGFFRETAYLDGNQDNMKKGIDVANSDFFPLKPGANVLTVSGFTGSAIDVLWQGAYA